VIETLLSISRHQSHRHGAIAGADIIHSVADTAPVDRGWGDLEEKAMLNILDPDMPKQGTWSMAELVEMTGFSERNIRHYISEGLVEGARGMGRNARYGKGTLRRLKLISKLKDQVVEPLGRPMTLKEIKNTLDSLGESEIDYLLSGTAEFRLIDTDSAQGTTNLSLPSNRDAHDDEYEDLQNMHSRRHDPDLEATAPHALAMRPPAIERSQREINDWIHELGDFGRLLQRLRDILKDLTDEETAVAPPAGDTWMRVKSPDIEVHIKAPRTRTERARLRVVERAVEKLIELGPGHNLR